MDDMEYETAAEELSPQAPSIDHLSYGGLVGACRVVKLHPPNGNSTSEMDDTRKELKELSVRYQLDLMMHMCSAAYADLQWLCTRDVHGAGSVVRYGTDKSIAVILRPEVWRDYEKATKLSNKLLAYRTIAGNLVKAYSITDVLVHTEWSMGEFPTTIFANDIPYDVWFLSAADKKVLADKWGMDVDGYFPQQIQELVTARAVLETERQFMSVVNAAWKGAFTTYKPGERPPRAVANSPDVGEDEAGAPGQAAAVGEADAGAPGLAVAVVEADAGTPVQAAAVVEDAPTSAVAKGDDPTGADGAGPAKADDAEDADVDEGPAVDVRSEEDWPGEVGEEEGGRVEDDD